MSFETPSFSHSEDGPELCPSFGMRYRHYVRGYALEQRQRPGLGHWNEILLLDNGELAEVIGDANSKYDVVELVAAWLRGTRNLSWRASRAVKGAE